MVSLLCSRFWSGAPCAALAGIFVTGFSISAFAQESFFEPFDTLSSDRWYISDGWTNGAHQNCWWSREAVALDDGALILRVQPNSDPERPYLCGEIQTNDRFHYGTYEVSYRMEEASGLNAAFFTYIGPVHDRPHDEIDVEILSRDPGRVEFNTFVAGEMHNGGATTLSPPADEVFHTFAFVWDETGIRWYLNGTMVHETTQDPLVEHAQKIYLSHWSSDTFTEWMGPFSAPDRPVEMVVDWVAWTAPGDGCQFEASLLCTIQNP